MLWLLFYFRLGFIAKVIRNRERSKWDTNCEDSQAGGKEADQNFFRNESVLSKARYILKSFVVRPALISFIMHSFICLFGYFVSPFYFSLHLLLIINLSPTAKYVLHSIFRRSHQLAMTVLLAIFMIYSYSILTTAYFHNDFIVELNEMGICNDVISCFLHSLNLGLRNGGGIADSMNPLDNTDPFFEWKIFFDLSYFALINIVSLNIIFGIIIDSFAELRDAGNNRDEDLRNICFICNYTRDQFEKEGVDFDNHCDSYHNPIIYVNYLVYLKSKNHDEFDGIEGYVYEQYKQAKTNWVPISNTDHIKLEDDEASGVQALSQKFASFQQETNLKLDA